MTGCALSQRAAPRQVATKQALALSRRGPLKRPRSILRTIRIIKGIRFMRKWHRWITVFFGVFMLWMAVTGIASHVTALWPEGAQAAAPAAPEGFVCPETMMCRPKARPGGMKSLVGWFHHLHSGEEFGPVGTAISLMTGFALLFFGISGLWMYISMWRSRKDRSLKPGWFWK
ncbi:PepSY domain-containing protein [Novosphingobium lubricantis]